MEVKEYKKQIRSKILYAKEWAEKHGRFEIERDMNKLLDYLDSVDFDLHDFLWFSSYATVLKIWGK